MKLAYTFRQQCIESNAIIHERLLNKDFLQPIEHIEIKEIIDEFLSEQSDDDDIGIIKLVDSMDSSDSNETDVEDRRTSADSLDGDDDDSNDLWDGFYCDVCRKGFYSSQGLTSHMETQHTLLLHRTKCTICSQQCPNKKLFDIHMKDSHSRANIICSQTSSLCHSNANKKMKDFECTHCKSRFPKKILLQRHFKALHKLPKCVEKTSHECPFFCGKSFASLRNVNFHVQVSDFFQLFKKQKF